MKQHKNDFNPGPLTESGYSGRSCYQADMPGNDRMPVELPVEGHQRLISIPREGSPGIERVKSNGASHIRLKLRTKAQTGNPGIIHLYPQVKSPGFLHCLDVAEFRRRTLALGTNQVKLGMEVLYANLTDEIPIKIFEFLRCPDDTEFQRRIESQETDPMRTELEVSYPNSTYKIQIKFPGFLQYPVVKEFRRRTAFLETIPLRKELKSLNTNSSNKIPKGRIVNILPDIALKPPRRNVFSSGSYQKFQRIWNVKFLLKTCFRWRKTMISPELVFSLKKLEFNWREILRLPYLVVSLIEQEFSRDVKNGIFKASKLRLCQS